MKPLPVEPSVCGAMGWPVEMMDVAMARPGMVRLWSCRDGQRAEGERVTDCLLHWRLVLHTCEKENWESPGPVLPQISPAASTRPPESGTHWHDMTQNKRRSKVCCICKTTGILGESCSVSLACLPDSAQRRGKRKWVYLCDPIWVMLVREGTEKRQGRWVNCMSQGTSGERETDKPLGQFRACWFSGSRL